jgi:hypothetical protein
MGSLEHGIRKEIWHGWEYARNHRAEFEERKSEILNAVRKQLAGFRIFVADIGTEPRILERLEAAIMNNLYQQSSPFCDIPDKGMYLAKRLNSEIPITVKNNCSAVLHGLQAFLDI